MLGTLLQGTENKNAALRLREMVTVLRRHEIVHGLTPVKLRGSRPHLCQVWADHEHAPRLPPDGVL